MKHPKVTLRIDPIKRDDFNIRRKREANPERINRIRELARHKGRYGRLLEIHIREAIKTGHSYRQVADAAGVSISVIQRIMQREEEK